MRKPIQSNDVEQFVTIFCKFISKGKSRTELAKAMGISVASVSARAGYLRKKGVNLPKFQTGGKGRRRTGTLTRLNNLVKKHYKPFYLIEKKGENKLTLTPADDGDTVTVAENVITPVPRTWGDK